MTGGSSRLTVGSLNLHAGRDRNNRPFDPVAACASLAAEVLVLQEVWWPSGGISQAAVVAGALGYEYRWSSFGAGTIAPVDVGKARWVRCRGGRLPTVRLDGSGNRQAGGGDGERGALGIAVLSRLPVLASSTARLPDLGRDRARRSALLVTVEVGSTSVEVVGTHMAHLSQGSLRQYAWLRGRAGSPADRRLLAGDMNLWGPVVERLLPGWRRAVVGRTWPAQAPIAQPDHILAGSGLVVAAGRVLGAVGSDHRPIVAELVVPERS